MLTIKESCFLNSPAHVIYVGVDILTKDKCQSQMMALTRSVIFITGSSPLAEADIANLGQDGFSSTFGLFSVRRCYRLPFECLFTFYVAIIFCVLFLLIAFIFILFINGSIVPRGVFRATFPAT